MASYSLNLLYGNGYLCTCCRQTWKRSKAFEAADDSEAFSKIPEVLKEIILAQDEYERGDVEIINISKSLGNSTYQDIEVSDKFLIKERILARLEKDKEEEERLEEIETIKEDIKKLEREISSNVAGIKLANLRKHLTSLEETKDNGLTWETWEDTELF